VNSDTKKPKDPLANIPPIKPKNPSAEASATRPKNPSANVLPTEGYVLEIDGKFKSEYQSSDDAMKAGLELKKKFPYIQVIVFGAKDRTRTLVSLSGQSEKKTETALWASSWLAKLRIQMDASAGVYPQSHYYKTVRVLLWDAAYGAWDWQSSDHRWTMRQSLSNLVFKHFLPPFKIENVIWFRYDIFAI
jgi:hypothetical protein